MNQQPVNQAVGQANGAAQVPQQPLANNASPAAIQASQKQQFIKVDEPYNELRLELRKPIIFDGKTYSQMIFREVNLGDMTLLDESDDQMAGQLAVFSAMTNNQVPPEVFQLMPAREVGKILSFLEACLEGFPMRGLGTS